MITRLTQAEVDRATARSTRLDDDEIAGFATLLGGAGAETVTKLVGNAVVPLPPAPRPVAEAHRRPAAIPGAVEEILRYCPPSQYQGRFSVARSAIRRGHGPGRLPDHPGHRARPPATSASSTTPTTSTSTGRPASRSGFGYGIHSCLGAALARMESRIAIEELAALAPTIEVDEAGLARVHMSNVAGYSSVPVPKRLMDPYPPPPPCR